MPNVLSVDPGKVTGYVIWIDGTRIEGELPAREFLLKAESIIENKEVDFVISERYIIGAQTGKFSQAPWSLEQIGVLRHICEKHNVPFVLQNASDAKRFSTDERLDGIGWYKPPGAGHARDAQRHLLLYLTKNKIIDLKIFVKRTSF
jgi:hypothetical protein